MRDGDLLLYAASFIDNPLGAIPYQAPLRYDGAWKDLDFFVRWELDITMIAQEMEEEAEEGELADEDEPCIRSRTGSTQQPSAADSNVTLGEQEPPDDSNRAPMTDFQWEQKWKCCYPVPGDRLY